MIRMAASCGMFVMFLAAAVADDKKLKDLILGKWESQEGTSKGVVVEYKADGTTVASFKEKTFNTGRYKFVEDDVMEFEATFIKADKKLINRYRIKIVDDELIKTDLNAKTESKLKRVK